MFQCLFLKHSYVVREGTMNVKDGDVESNQDDTAIDGSDRWQWKDQNGNH